MNQANDELNNSDAWLVIPEFGVMPDEVDFEGFEFSVFGPDGNQSLGEILTPLVSSARNLVKAQFSTLAELNAAEEEVLELVTNDGQPVDDAVLDHVIDGLTEPQSSCLLYMTVMAEFMYVTWRSNDEKSRFEVLGLAAATLSMWRDHGAREAVKRMKSINTLNASQDRPRAKSQLRKAVLIAMRPNKLSGQVFKSFMQMWELEPLKGLRLSQLEDTNDYKISDENGQLGEKKYSLKTLESMYSSLK